MVAYRFLGYVLVLLRRCTRIYFPTKTYISRTHKLFFWDAAIRNSLPSNKEQNILLYVCVIQHRNWPLRSTILNAHSTNASLDGLCTRTHTNKTFSCCFCCNSLELIDPGAETCVYQAKACSPTDQPVRKLKDGLGINMTMKTFFTLHIASCEKHDIM